MPLEDVLPRFDYATDLLSETDAADFKQQCDSLIAEAYLGSPVAAAMFETLVAEDRTITIQFVPNTAEASTSQGFLNFDFAAPDDYIFLDPNGNLFQSSDRRIFIHELVHAIEGVGDFDPTVSVNSIDYDFVGPTVTKTNLIEEQLGSTDMRVSYYGNFSANYPDDYSDHLDGYTNGEAIDIAYTLTPLKDLAFLDLSLQSLPTNDLVIGLDSDNTILTGDGNDWLYGGGGTDFLDAGSDNDWIDGGAGADIIDGGAGIDVLHFDKTTAGVTVDFQTLSGDGTGAGGDAAGDTYTDIEVVIGTDSVDNFKAWDGSGMLFAGGGETDRFEVLRGGINNKVNACAVVQPEVNLIVNKVLIIATITFQSQFFA